jgi:hypothetical protein
MIITEKHAMKLVREGKAIIVGIVPGVQIFGYSSVDMMAVIDRYDKHRTDHFPLTMARFKKLHEKWGEK